MDEIRESQYYELKRDHELPVSLIFFDITIILNGFILLALIDGKKSQMRSEEVRKLVT
jgi:hypothetical protein